MGLAVKVPVVGAGRIVMPSKFHRNGRHHIPRQLWDADYTLGDRVHETARLRDLTTIEARVRAFLPTGVLSPPDLRNAALQRVRYAPAVLGSVELHRVVHVAPVWRPLLTDLGRQVRLTWRNPGDPDAAWFAGELGSD